MSRPEPAEDAPSSGWWGWREALIVVVGAHVALIVVGSVFLAAGGWGGSSGGRSEPVPIAGSFVATVPFWVAAVAGAWWLARRSPVSPREALALSVRPLDVPLGIAVGVAMQLVVIPVVYWPILRALGSSTRELEQAARDLADSAHGAGGATLFVLMACVFAPCAEELLYRGVLQRSRDWSSAVIGIVVTSLLFGLLHLEPLQFVGLALFGAASGVLVWRTGRLGPGIVAHIAFNAATVIPLLWRR
ncbi:MAG: CPBP family intramembrane glutamic endopeptidase [Acidimicrobiales bacterium]